MIGTEVSFTPMTPREKQIANSLGVTNWRVIAVREDVICFGNAPGTLITKNGHVR